MIAPRSLARIIRSLHLEAFDRRGRRRDAVRLDRTRELPAGAHHPGIRAAPRRDIPILRSSLRRAPSGLADLEPGDLLFWATDPSNPATIHHVAIYAGNGYMIAAPHTGADVTLQRVYLDGFIGATRPTG